MFGMNNYCAFFMLSVMSVTSCVAQETKSIAEIFLPGIVSSDSNDFNACFSRDRNSFYFSRSSNRKTGIYVISMINGKWSAPELLPFCKDGFSYADPAFSPAGELYFISNRPTSPSDTVNDYDIWKTSLTNNRWNELVNVSSLNSAQDEYYISFAENGDAYFSSSRRGGYGEEDIYVAKFADQKFQEPENVGTPVNSAHSEYDPFISSDGSILIFASNGRSDSFGKADLYWTEKKKNWGPLQHFDSTINTRSRDYCPYLTDDDAFYFSSEGQVKKIPLYRLPYHLRHQLDR